MKRQQFVATGMAVAALAWFPMIAWQIAKPASAQSAVSSRCCVNVNLVPSPEDLRSFSLELTAAEPRDLLTVPQGRVFVVTDVVMDPGVALSALDLRENGLEGPLRARFWGGHLGGAEGIPQIQSPTSGIMFAEGNTVTVVRTHNGSAWATISGYLASVR